MKHFLTLLTALLFTLPVYSETTDYKYEDGTAFITLTRKPEPKKNLSTNVSVISKKQIKETNSIEIRDLLKDAVGITDVSKQGTVGATSNMRIRSGGDTSKQVLVMIDGLPINNPATGSADLSYISTENIEKIEIVRGPSSALYGSSALNGAVNIITKKPKIRDLELGIILESFNTKITRYSYADKKGIFSWLVSGSETLSDGWRKNSAYNGSNVNTVLGLDLKKAGKLSLNGNYFSSKTQTPGLNFTSLKDYDEIKELEATTPKANQDDTNNYIALNHEISLSENYKLLSKVYTRSTCMLYKDSDNLTDDANTIMLTGAVFQLNLPGDIVAGTDLQNQHYKKVNHILNVEDINKTFTINSFFLQKSFSYQALRTTLGLRYDDHSVYGSQLNPRLNSIYDITDTAKLSFNAGRSFTGPTFEHLYSPLRTWDYLGSGGETIGNENILPETAIGYDLGFEKNFNDNTISKITLFRTDLENKIEWTENYLTVPGYFFYSQWKPQNIGEAYNQGVEFELNSKLSESISNEINLTYLESMGKKGTETKYKTLSYAPPYHANFSLVYKSPSGITEKISAAYVDKQEWVDDYSTKHRLDAYTLVNLMFIYSISYSEFFFEISNLADTRYQTRENYPLSGRTFRGGITLKY
ncbi:MAG: hypothetical protein A2252_12615 [Elusimicrobia bacterium RIFOXYA2_FULL_39_19]|nr:MAG: hypothetical protein A2252_12615 [Elusimicrobia bacterium RIFOXYA2_FULL_39_19]